MQIYTKKLDKKNNLTHFFILLHVFINYLFKIDVISEFGGKITLNIEKPYVIFRQKFVYFRQYDTQHPETFQKCPFHRKTHLTDVNHERKRDYPFNLCYLWSK